VTYWISLMRQTVLGGVSTSRRVAVYEVKSWQKPERALEEFARGHPGLTMPGGREYLAISMLPPRLGGPPFEWHSEVAP